MAVLLDVSLPFNSLTSPISATVNELKYSITIQIVGWNSSKSLSQALTGLLAVPDGVVIRYIDNASTDDSVRIIREQLARAEVLELPMNVGFTNAHNICFALCTTDFVLTHDPDLQLEWAGVERMLAVMNERRQVGAMQGKLLRADDQSILDSAGIVLSMSRNGQERGAGRKDDGQFAQGAAIDAVTGACGLYRMESLRSVAHGEYNVAGMAALEVFDKDFFAYKDDVDLGWRLIRKEWEVWYEPVMTGYHTRSVGARGVMGWGLSRRGILKRLKSERTRYSVRNYVWMLIKNMTWRDELRYDWFILPRLMVFLGFSCLYWPLFRVWSEIGAGVITMAKKRNI